MEKKPEPKGKAELVRKIVTTLLVLVILAGLFWGARVLVGSVDIVELLKKIHGG